LQLYPFKSGLKIFDGSHSIQKSSVLQVIQPGILQAIQTPLLISNEKPELQTPQNLSDVHL